MSSVPSFGEQIGHEARLEDQPGYAAPYEKGLLQRTASVGDDGGPIHQVTAVHLP
jgi:hypothetical protein